MSKEQRRERAKRDVEHRRKQDKRSESIQQHEQEINLQSMPPWARVLYHQNKAIMAELGIEE